MRIAFLVSHFPKLSETFILNQITGLMDRGHHVDIFTQQIEDWSVVHPDVNRYRLIEHTYRLPQIPSNYLVRAVKGIGLILTQFYKRPKLLARSLNVFAHGEQAAGLWLLHSATALVNKDLTYDIVHCQFGTLGYQGLALKRLIKPTPKLVLMFRGFDISCHVRKGGDKTYRKLFRDVDYSLVNCDFFRQRVIELGCAPERVTVHFSGLDVKKFDFCPCSLKPGESIRVASTGRLVEKKGFEYAIKAIVKQRKATPDLSYYIIGDGPLRSTLERLIDELDAKSYIHLLGWKDESKIIQILNNCHLFIAPSVTASDGNQDAPINVLKEAMALGLPVVSTYHGGIPELVEDGVSGFLVPERDVDSLVEKLSHLIAHPERWPQMGKAGRAFIEQHFDLNNLNEKLVKHYRDLVGIDDNFSLKDTGSHPKKTALLSSD